jgi:NAD(P)-dependent dehydrogenase (short-subunit alcohol dehydrogenase family)
VVGDGPGTVAASTSVRGRTVLVTGGANGIGAASVRLLAGHGARVVVADRDEDAGRTLAEEVGARFVPLDVAHPTEWAALPEVDAAFLNAGVMAHGTPCTLADLGLGEWGPVRAVNIEGVVNGLAHLLPGMAERGWGSILLAGSLAGLVGFAPDPFYAASKALVISLARSVGALAAGSGVRVNALCPGEVSTRMLPEDRADLLARRGYRPLHPDEVAIAVVEVLEDSASGQVWSLVQGRPRALVEPTDVPRPLRLRPPQPSSGLPND